MSTKLDISRVYLEKCPHCSVPAGVHISSEDPENYSDPVNDAWERTLNYTCAYCDKSFTDTEHCSDWSGDRYHPYIEIAGARQLLKEVKALIREQGVHSFTTLYNTHHRVR